MKINDFVKVVTLVSALFCSIMVYSQDSLPPPEAMPSEEEMVLIDVLLEISGFEIYFVQRATDGIEEMLWQKKWSEKQVLERKKRISYEEFLKNNNMYNLLSMLTKKELEELINFSRKMNERYTEPKVFFTTPLIESRINSFILYKYLN